MRDCRVRELVAPFCRVWSLSSSHAWRGKRDRGNWSMSMCRPPGYYPSFKRSTWNQDWIPWRYTQPIARWMITPNGQRRSHTMSTAVADCSPRPSVAIRIRFRLNIVVVCCKSTGIWTADMGSQRLDLRTAPETISDRDVNIEYHQCDIWTIETQKREHPCEPKNHAQ